jgi:glycerol kinase
MPKNSRYILGVDQGTTSTRAALLSEDGLLTEPRRFTHAQHLPKPGWVEHDAEELWRNTRRALLAAASDIRHPPVGIALANQGETVVLWDRGTGKPLHRAIVWQDVRTQAAIDRLSRIAKTAARVRERTGLMLDPYFSASKIEWLLEHCPGASRLAGTGRLAAGTLDAWLIWKLTAGERFITDPSTAARTLLFDVRRMTFDPWLLDRFSVPRAILPEVVPSTGALGTVKGLGPELDGVPLVASVVDQPAALFGHGCLTEGTLKATCGTGCFVYLNTGNQLQPSRHGLLSTIVWQRGASPTYALEGGLFAAGSVVNWLSEALGLFPRASDLDRLCRRARDPGVMCVPAMAGLAAPHWRRKARAAWAGLSLGSTRADIARAALEGIAAGVAEIVEAMQGDIGRRVKRLRMDGGLTRCEALMQMQADWLGIPVEAVEDPECTLRGVCAMAARELGIWTSDERVLAHARGGRTYRPALSTRARNDRRARYRRLSDFVAEFNPETT